MQFASIQPIDKALSGATIPDQSGLGSEGNEGVLRIYQSCSITGISSSVSYLEHLLKGEGSYAVGVFKTPAHWAVTWGDLLPLRLKWKAIS